MSKLKELYLKYEIDPDDFYKLFGLLRNKQIQHEFVDTALAELSKTAFTREKELRRQLLGMSHSTDYNFTYTITVYISYIWAIIGGMVC